MKEQNKNYQKLVIILFTFITILCIILLIPNVQKTIISLTEKTVLHRSFNHPEKWILLISKFSLFMFYINAIFLFFFVIIFSKEITKKTFLFFIVIQLFICYMWGIQKRGYMEDEIFSYGLANSKNYTWVDYDSSRAFNESGWVTKEYFEAYTKAELKDVFNFIPAYKNQVHDVHPPLYYFLLHISSCLFGQVLSKWPGLVLNFIILICIDFLLLYISNYFFNDKTKSMISIILWTFSAAGLSNIMLIRMYLLQTLEFLLFVIIHIWMYTKHPKYLKFFLAMTMTVIAGGLTHYYFYVFAFAFSLPTILYLFGKTYKKNLIKYCAPIITGGLFNIIFFPATIIHIFMSYRGKEVANNLSNLTSNTLTKIYIPLINKSIFGGLFPIFIFISIFIICKIIFEKHFSIHNDINYEKLNIQIEKKNKEEINTNKTITLSKKKILFINIFFAIFVFTVITTIGSELHTNRYIFAIYPFLAILIIFVINWFYNSFGFENKYKNLCISFIAITMCLLSTGIYKISYLYSSFDNYYAKLYDYKGYDCLIYYNNWRNIQTENAINLLFDESYFFNEEDLPQLGTALHNRKTADKIIVNIPRDLENTNEILNDIKSACGFTNCELICEYVSSFYEMN